MFASIEVSVTRRIGGSAFPPIVEFCFVDCAGTTRRFLDKLPIVCSSGSEDELPRTGWLRCEIRQRTGGFVQISTAEPDGVETIDGISEFLVPVDLLSSLDSD